MPHTGHGKTTFLGSYRVIDGHLTLDETFRRPIKTEKWWDVPSHLRGMECPGLDDTALVTCWCEGGTTDRINGAVVLREHPIREIREGRTWSCGRPGCKPIEPAFQPKKLLEDDSMALKLKGNLGELARMAQAQGWTIEVTGGGHAKWTPPDPQYDFIITSTSPKKDGGSITQRQLEDRGCLTNWNDIRAAKKAKRDAEAAAELVALQSALPTPTPVANGRTEKPCRWGCGARFTDPAALAGHEERWCPNLRKSDAPSVHVDDVPSQIVQTGQSQNGGQKVPGRGLMREDIRAKANAMVTCPFCPRELAIKNIGRHISGSHWEQMQANRTNEIVAKYVLAKHPEYFLVPNPKDTKKAGANGATKEPRESRRLEPHEFPRAPRALVSADPEPDVLGPLDAPKRRGRGRKNARTPEALMTELMSVVFANTGGQPPLDPEVLMLMAGWIEPTKVFLADLIAHENGYRAP